MPLRRRNAISSSRIVDHLAVFMSMAAFKTSYCCLLFHYITQLVLAVSLKTEHRSIAIDDTNTNQCRDPPATQWLSDPPFENYFYSDCHSATQVVVTSPLPDSNLTIIGPRVLVAWPAGNSGAVAFLAPQNGVNGTLGIRLENDSTLQPLNGVYHRQLNSKSGNPMVGINALLNLNSSAVLTIAMMGSIRTLRDFSEGPSILQPSIQEGNMFAPTAHGGATISRLWFDNETTSQMTFQPYEDSGAVTIEDRKLRLKAGTYIFTATFDYPQLQPLNRLVNQQEVLNQEDSGRLKSLEFLSYSKGLLAGAWKFLTYFGRDSMIAALLLQPVLSDDAIEAVISAVLERLNSTSGSVCHEETIGDYATFLNLQKNITGPEAILPGCTYPMIDTNYYLPILLESYFLKSASGRNRMTKFWNQKSSLEFGNKGLTYRRLAEINAAGIMNKTAAFPGNRTKENLIHIEPHEIVGQWRDTSYGIGGGRIPYDVNTALAPAALRSISALSAAGWFPESSWNATTALTRSKIFEDHTLDFFHITIPKSSAQTLVENYTTSSGYGFPSLSQTITSEINFHGLSLDGNKNNNELIKVMNTDDCFRLFLLTETTNNPQLTSFLNTTATNLRSPFPIGLMSPIGLFISNPAYGGSPEYAKNFTKSVYHGTVVWSWQMAMMAAGLERQLRRCDEESRSVPTFCEDQYVRKNVLGAYNELWDVIERNGERLEGELWSWVYEDGTGFKAVPLSTLPPEEGEPQTEESDIRQLWSLAFLAVKRDEKLR